LGTDVGQRHAYFDEPAHHFRRRKLIQLYVRKLPPGEGAAAAPVRREWVGDLVPAGLVRHVIRLTYRQSSRIAPLYIRGVPHLDDRRLVRIGDIRGAEFRAVVPP
jgi:hypothetical protein